MVFIKILEIPVSAEQRMCLGTFSRLRRSLATSTLYAAVRILAELFLLYRKAISCKVKRGLCFLTCRQIPESSFSLSSNQIIQCDILPSGKFSIPEVPALPVPDKHRR
jgi:hypothetical protein